MIDKIYSDKIIKYASNIPLQQRLVNPDATASKRSVSCGSNVEVDIITKNKIITKFGQQINACALGSTTASIVANTIIGAKFSEVILAQKQMQTMLKTGQGAPTGRFKELKLLASVKDYPNRHASTLLVLDALVAAIKQIKIH